MKTWHLRSIHAVATALMVAGSVLGAQEIGFIEDFSLAEDRAKPLQQLIPGTEDFYYYHCLHYQHSGQLDRVRELLAQWIKRHNVTTRVREIQDRQALLEYKGNPRKSLDHIRDRLKLRFEHQKQVADRETHHPTRLDPALITREAFLKRAFSKHRNLNGVSGSGLDYLDATKLNPDRRRHFLQRLEIPDYPGLPKLVVEDLDYKQSRGFGSFAIHSALTLTQLNECLKLRPNLLKETRFINTYMAKLHPDADVAWKYDDAEKEAYLGRLWTFVRQLPAAQNSLKAHVLYRRLAHDRSRGVYDRDRFIEYLKLPRQVGYIRRDYVERPEHKNVRANLRADYHGQTRLPPVGVDEELVRDTLQHFLKDAADYEAFSPYIEQTYLKEIFAETKVLYGIGDMEQWYSMLPPAKLQTIRERVEINWLPLNPVTFGVKDPVKLRADVKNVPKLIVKVYEINTRSFYTTHKREVTTAVDLDGLVANHQRDLTYEQVAYRRHAEEFAFPEIVRPGVYVVELIGNGKSSRALVRKGRLSFTERIGAAGHVFRVYDEDGNRLRDASVLLESHKYDCDEHGEIAIPFSTKPGSQQIVLLHGEFAALHRFNHAGETYNLQAVIYADRESLVAGETCRVIVRPRLAVSGVPVDIALLEKVKLSISSVDGEDIPTTSEIADFKLFNDKESVHELRVPESLRGIGFTLSGEVPNISTGKRDKLEVHSGRQLNQIDKTEHTEDIHLGKEDEGYVLSLLGKTGEAIRGRPVTVVVRHRDFTDEHHVTLQSDDHGRVDLGRLEEVVHIEARNPVGVKHRWHLQTDEHSYPSAIHALQGEAIHVPLMTPPGDPSRLRVALLELRANTVVRDALHSAQFADGFLVMRDLPAGDYELTLKREQVKIPVRVTAGKREGNMLLAKSRCLETGDTHALHISDVTADAKGEHLVIRLANATPSTRVSVVATRFVPGDLRDGLIDPGWDESPLGYRLLHVSVSQYLSGRSIGDEYRYVLERAYAKKYPGNLLERPGLILNPWSLRKTEADKERLTEGEAWDGVAAAEARGGRLAAKRAASPAPELGASAAQFANYDFLPTASPVLTNLKPDEKGEVRVAAKELADRQHIHVLAVDGASSAYRQVSLPRDAVARRNRTLRRGLAADGHFTEQKEISLVAKGKPFVIDDMRTSSMEVYDTLSDVYGLFTALSGNTTLAEFSFILNWPDLPADRKQELYSKYACHELSIFLAHKDPDFFVKVIKPYLANKKDKTFLDLWLLERDLSAYLRPWTYARLNTAERILLGQRVPNESAAAARHIRDLTDLLPPDVERFYRLFDTAIKAGDLDGGDGFTEGIALEIVDEKQSIIVDSLSRLAAPEAPRAANAVALGAVQKSLRGLAEKKAESKPMRKEMAKMALGDLMQDRMNFGLDAGRRRHARKFYRQLDKTEEWVENNYYHLPVEEQLADLVEPSAFWVDYAAHGGEGPFLSPHVAEAAGTFTEMMLALAVLDLPFKADKPNRTYDEAKLTMVTAGPAIVFHKEIKSAKRTEDALLLVSQNVFARDDRYRHEGNERFDKFVTKEFRTHRVYGCQVVLTNPTSSRRKVEVLMQIPVGAMPVLNGFYTRSIHRQLEPYSTQTVEYYFYFPGAGDHAHYPVHVAQNEEIIANAEPFTFHVVEKLTLVDKTSWSYVSQNATNEEVLDFLGANNVDRLDLSVIAFRMKDRGVFSNVVQLLQRRHVYDHVLWSYSILHGDTAVAREYLRHSPYSGYCGLFIDAPLLTVDPVPRHTYQHKEYSPLVNPRVYALGKERTILNRQFYEQYMQFLQLLSYRPALRQDDLLALTYYLLLQDRIDDAMRSFVKIDSAKVAERMQYDYLAAYMAFYREAPADARRIAKRYSDYPVDRWRERFEDVLAQVDELDGKAATVVNEDDRAQSQTRLADTEPSFDFRIENDAIHLQYRNIARCRVNVYAMDIELVFSRKPFVQDMSGEFSVVRPNHAFDVDLAAGKTEQVVKLPAAFQGRNVMVEIVAAGQSKSVAHYPHALGLQVMENYGQLRVSEHGTERPLAKVYVKVYARQKGGEVRFYKDGYTDLRGRFDYTSLNTGDLDQVETFAILVASEKHGSLVRTVAPPKR